MSSTDTARTFIGPTACGLARRLLDRPEVRVLPPAERGSITGLTNRHAPGVIVIVDGRFGDVPAVGHAELLAALDMGWRIWGVASMGAIRAVELEPYGMVGYGRVYEHLKTTSAGDDEVAVLHGPAPAYQPISEALVDLRGFLAGLTARGTLTERQADDIDGYLAGLWFGDRTLHELCHQIRRIAGDTAGQATVAQLPELIGRRTKTTDLARFLQERPWTRPPRSSPPNSTDGRSSTPPSTTVGC